MKKLTIISCIVLLFSACKKDCQSPCITDIEDDIVLDTHFNKIGCTGSGNIDFEWQFDSEQEYKAFQCTPNNIPFEIGFNGIIVAQGVKVPYTSYDENINPSYEKSVEIKKDSCDRAINFHFILENVDTSELFEHNENVIVLLNGVDASYTVNFSHEIIPFGE